MSNSISAPIQRCFDAARSIDVHLQSMKHTGEIAIAGRTSGLCELNDEVTWQATHLGIRQRLTSRITEMKPPNHFTDTMLKGAFKSLRHHHYFEEHNGITTMTDVFIYETPLGFLGRLFNRLVLRNYMIRLLEKRNEAVKKAAEKIN